MKAGPAVPNQPQEPNLKGDSMMPDTTIASPNKYVAHFNRVVSNYADALLLDGQGSVGHQRAAQAVDNLMREYAIATALLDYVKFDLCFGPIERCKNTGGDYRALAGQLQATYPLLAGEIQQFTEADLATAPA
jgi:hypothetical protein